MLKIKATQMRALGSEARRRFEASAIALLREEFPQNTGDRPDDVLRQLVCVGIQ